MTEQSESRSSAAAVTAAVVIVVVLLPLLYVLSIGPVAWLAERDLIDGGENSLAHSFYWPLIWLHENSSPFRQLIDLYLQLWTGS